MREINPFHEPYFSNPNEYRNPNDESGDRTPERPSTFGLRISFVICHSTTAVGSRLIVA
jgi:hypothetical protein